MTPEEKLLLKLNGLFFFALSLAGIFVTVFLFQLGGFKAVVSYGLVSLTVLLIVYILSGYLLKKFSSLFLIRLGFLFFCGLYSLLFLFQEHSLDYLILLGIINGVANGNYWAGNNLTQYIATYTHSRNEYFGKLNFFINIGSAFGPILGGTMIYFFNLSWPKIFGYATLFALVALLFFVLFLIAGKLPRHKGVEFSFFSILNHKRKASWVVVLSQQFFYGLFDVSFGAFSAILIFIFLKEELTLGAVNTLSMVVYALANLAAIRFLNKKKYAYIFGMVISPVALLVFGLQQNWIGILSLVIVNNLFLPLLNITTAKAIYDVIDTENAPWQQKYHFLVERDAALGLARVLSYAVLIWLFTLQNQLAIAKSWILIIPVAPFIIGLLQLYEDLRLGAEV